MLRLYSHAIIKMPHMSQILNVNRLDGGRHTLELLLLHMKFLMPQSSHLLLPTRHLEACFVATWSLNKNLCQVDLLVSG